MGLDKVEVELRLIQLLCKSEGLRLKISDQPFKIENKLLQLQSTESLQFSVQVVPQPSIHIQDNDGHIFHLVMNQGQENSTEVNKISLNLVE